MFAEPPDHCGGPHRHAHPHPVLGLLEAPISADGQQGKVFRIGYLGIGSLSAPTHPVEAFRQGLRDLGWVEGQNVAIEYRFTEGEQHRLRDLAADLVRLKVDVIVVEGPSGIRAAKQATTTIPIVVAVSGDPVGSGFVASLARPGGNITGLSFLASELNGKRLELLKEAVPHVSRVAALWNPANPGAALWLREAEV